jgi:hypothetical protein
MGMKPNKTVVATTVTRKWEISEEAVEDMIRNQLGITAGEQVDFYWDTRSDGYIKGVSVTHKSTSTETK